jgi:hypothetical protein
MRRKLQCSNKSSLQSGVDDADIAIFPPLSTAAPCLIIFQDAP